MHFNMLFNMSKGWQLLSTKLHFWIHFFNDLYRVAYYSDYDALTRKTDF